MHKNLNKTQKIRTASVFFALPVILICGSAAVALAEGPASPANGQQQAQPGFGSMMVPFALMFGVIYFLMIRPQQKKMKEQQDMLTALKQGDEIVTASGMLGKVTGITEKVVTIEVADNVRVKMLKSQVSQVVKGQLKDNLA